MKHYVATAALAATVLFAPLAQAQNQAVLTWTAPTNYLNADGTVGPPITGILSYNVYQAIQGQPKVKVGAATLNKTVTINSGLLGGTTYCWAVTAFIVSPPADESPKSIEACKTFAPSVVAAPTLTVQ